MLKFYKSAFKFAPIVKKSLDTVSVTLRTCGTVEKDIKNDVNLPVKIALQKQINNNKLSIYEQKPPDKTGLLAKYFKDSGLLQELFRLNVNLHKIEKEQPEAVDLLLQLKFDDVRDYIVFLKELELSFDEIGAFITQNPMIFKEDLNDLEVRINYLESKKFTKEMITRIVSNNPMWLSYSTQEIDQRLGFFQQHFNLTGNEMRHLVCRRPKLITYPLEKIKINSFVLKEEMGFKPDEIKKIILNKPKLLVNHQKNLASIFDYLHNEMRISLERIVEEPQILNCRKKRLKQRYLFLVKLKRDQFDPLKPNYISLTSLVSGSDSEFAVEIAKSSVEIFNNFLKSL